MSKLSAGSEDLAMVPEPTDTAHLPSTVDSPMAIHAASYLTAINLLLANVQPIVLGSLATDYGLDDGTLGDIGAAFIGFISLVTLTAPWWVRRINWRTFSAIGAIVASAVLLAGAVCSTALGFIILFALLGAAKACVGAPAFASLGDATNAERSYGICIAWQSLIAAVAAVPLASYIAPHYGAPGVFISLSIISATAAIASRWMPMQGRAHAADNTGTAPLTMSKGVVAPLIGLLAIGIFSGGVLGYWYFIERIGAARGSAPGFIGIALSAASVANVASAALVARLGGRVRNWVLVLCGSALLILSFAVLQVKGDAAYLISNVMFSAGYGFAQPPYWAILRNVDTTDRLFVLATASTGAAGVIVGVMAGGVIGAGGYNGLIIMSASLIAAGGVLIALATRINALLVRPKT